MAENASQPWTWPEERWRGEIEKVRAGRNLKPKKWKGGRCAIALTFDCDLEARALAGGGGAEALAAGQYGVRAGLPRIQRLLKSHGVHGTFFLPAVSALLHAETARSLIAAGHEIGLTSWMSEPAATLPAETQQELLTGARTTLETATGQKPTGFRAARGQFSAATLPVLRDLGIIYDSSFAGDDDPYELTGNGEPTGLVELPYGLDDSVYFDGSSGTSPEEVFDIFRRELEIASVEGGLLVLRLHPEIVGRRSRLWIIDEFIKVARTLPGTWITTLADIAGNIRGRSGL